MRKKDRNKPKKDFIIPISLGKCCLLDSKIFFISIYISNIDKIVSKFLYFFLGKEDKSPTKPIPTNVIILIVGIGLGVILLIYFIVFFFWKLYKKSSSATEIAPPPPPIGMYFFF